MKIDSNKVQSTKNRVMWYLSETKGRGFCVTPGGAQTVKGRKLRCISKDKTHTPDRMQAREGTGDPRGTGSCRKHHRMGKLAGHRGNCSGKSKGQRVEEGHQGL